MKSILSIFLFAFLIVACAPKEQTTSTVTPEPEAMSFAGKPLFVAPPDSLALIKSDSAIAAIKSKGELTEDDYVDIGKQLVATARYKAAVANFTEGLSKYPESYKILRNRGHRYITLRQLDNSIADLTRAEQLLPKEGDVMEYGLDGKPTATVRHQIYYHIGVYNFLVKDYAKSAAAFEKAVATGGDEKNKIGASDWLYNSYQRLGEKDKATAAITPFNPTDSTDRASAYFQRVMLYKGFVKPEGFVDEKIAPEKLGVQDVTKMYGLANWYKYQGNQAKADTLYTIILTAPTAWPGFAYAAAEKEMSGK